MDLATAFHRLRGTLLMRLDERSRLAMWLRDAWKQKIPPTGRMLLLVLLAVAPVSAAVTVSQPLYYFSVFLFCLLFVGRLGGLVFAPRIRLERHLPERCPAGVPIRVHARVRNTGWLPVYDLAATELGLPPGLEHHGAPEYLDCLPRGAEADLYYNLLPNKRGAYDLRGAAAMTAFPFGVYNHTKRFRDACRMLVYPRFGKLDQLRLPVGRRYQPGGLQLVSQVGDSEEFLGNREYRPGDRVRDLDHRAWARVGFPVVREFQQEYLCRVGLILDTFVPGQDARDREGLEAALSLAASIADMLSRREYVIDVFAAGPDLYHFQAGRSLAYLDNILDVLACIEPCHRSPFETIGPALTESARQISTAVVIMLNWDNERETFVRTLQDLGVEVKLLVVRDRATTFDPTAFSLAEPAQVFTPEQIRSGVKRL